MGRKRMFAVSAVTCLAAIAGIGLRVWNLRVGDQALSHHSSIVFFGVTLCCMALFLALALVSPGRSGRYSVFSGGGFPLSIAASVLILMGTGMEFAEALVAGPTMSAPIICLLGILGSICCMISAWMRRQGNRHAPAAELLPTLYLLVKLIFNFKHWSIDPIISDYVVILFALIFTLLSFHRGAGFFFDQGKPRATLFFSMAAVYFCAAATTDGAMSLSLSTVVTYCGFLLWHLPVIFCLSAPNGPDRDPQQEDPENEI